MYVQDIVLKKKVEIFLKKVLTFGFDSGIIVKRSRESSKILS